MARNHRFDSIIICDDVRWEVDSKEIIIGVYNNTMFMPSFPMIVPTLAVRVTAFMQSMNFDKCVIDIKTPTNNVIHAESSINKNPQGFNPDFPLPFTFKFSPFLIEQAGLFEISFGVDERPAKVGKFLAALREPEVVQSTAAEVGIPPKRKRPRVHMI